MSYTMTIDAPDEVVSYLERGSAVRNAELGRRFVAYLVAHYNALRAQEAEKVSSEPVLRSQPKYDFSEFFGKCKLGGDPVAFQRKLRDEW